MLYPKTLQKTVIDSGMVMEEATPTLIGYAKKINKLNNIVNGEHVPEEIQVLPVHEPEDGAEVVPVPVPTYRNGMIYPSVFGYEIPPEMTPRKLTPIIRNLPSEVLHVTG